MTKREFEQGIGTKVTEKMIKAANIVYMMDRNNGIAKPAFCEIWKSEEGRTEILMEAVIDLNEEKVAYSNHLREAYAKLRSENSQLRRDLEQAAHLLIDCSRKNGVENDSDDETYAAAVRMLGRKGTVMYCLQKDYALSKEDKEWLMKRL